MDACRCLLRQVTFAASAGIDVVQIRERDLNARALTAVVKDAVAIVSKTTTRVVVNDRVDIAVAAGAAGVHLRADSMSPLSVRLVAPAGFLIGRSVHSMGDAEDCSGVDYLIAGTVWPTISKADSNHPTIGAEGLAGIVRASRVPVLAIGGVTLARIAQAADAGAAGIAAIGLFMDAAAQPPNPCRAIPLEELAAGARRQFDTSKRAS